MHQSSYIDAFLGTRSNMTTRNTNTNTSNTQVIETNTHPLYLHNNDQPGMILISKKLLGSENYASWLRSMKIALSCKNKLVIVTDEFPVPAADSPLFVH